MKKQIFTLLTLLVLCVTGAWSADFVETYPTKPAYATSSFLTSVALGENATNSSNKIRVANNKTGNFTVSINTTKLPDFYVKSIALTTSSDVTADKWSSAQGGIVRDASKNYTFTPTTSTKPTSVSFALANSSGGNIDISYVSITMTDGNDGDIYETAYMPSTLSDGVGTPTSTRGASKIIASVQTDGSAGTSDGWNNVNFGNNKHLTINTSYPIKQIYFSWYKNAPSGNEKWTDNADGSYNASKNLWTAANTTTKSVTFTKNESNTANLPYMHIIYYPNTPTTPSFAAAGTEVEQGTTVEVTSGNATSIYYAWTSTESEPATPASWSYVAADASGVGEVPVPGDVTGTYYLYAYGKNTDEDGTIGHESYSIKVARKTTNTEITSASISALNTDIKNGTAAGILSATVTPEGESALASPAIVWSSSDESVATIVEGTGVVTLVGTGTTTITASYEGDASYNASSDTYEMTVTDTRTTLTLSFSSASITDYNYDGESLSTVTLSGKVGDDPVDISGFTISYSSNNTGVVTVGSGDGALTPVSSESVGTATITATFEGNATYKPASASYTYKRTPMLYQVKFDNGFEGFINEATKTIKVYYIAGTDAPSQSGTIQKADGFTANVVGSDVVLTKDAHTKTYAIQMTAVTPFVGSGKQTFAGAETYVASAYGWDDTKKWKFSKTDNDWTREAPGKTRIYFFVGAATSAAFSFQTAKNVDIYVNGVKQNDAPTTTVSNITLNADGPNMIEFQSNQTSGDGGFKDMTITGAKETISTASGKTYATYVTTNDLDFSAVSEEIKAYVALDEASEGNVNFTGKDEVPAGTPILVKTASAGATVYVPVATSTPAAIIDNKLVAGDGSAISYNAGANQFYYILSSGTFRPANNSVVAVGKAYLSLDATASANELTISFDDETTGIKVVQGSEFKVNGEYYNIAGQRIAQPTKGLYIVKGKKVIIK